MQNFRTRYRALSAVFADALATFPPVASPRPGSPLGGGAAYTVVDLTFADGTRLSGLLAWEGRVLLPEDAADRLQSVAITAIVATAADAYPDFTITDAASVREDAEGSIEMSNLERLRMFGPPDAPARDWRTVSIDEARSEALDDNRGVVVYPEIGAVRWIGDVQLTPDGFAMRAFRMRTDTADAVVVRPTSRALWSEILRYHTARVSPGVTLRALLTLLIETPPEVQAALAARLIDLQTPSFARYADALARTPDPEERSITWAPDAQITVGRVVDWDWEEDERHQDGAAAHRLTTYLDASVLASPAVGDDDTAADADGRLRWALAACPLRAVAELPIAIDTAFTVPHTPSDWEAWHRASIREPGDARPVAACPGPVFTADLVLTWDDALRALFTELPAR